MGKKSPKAPAAPDPKQTAAAQTASNKETAYWNAILNNVNQVTPYGSISYTDPSGGVYDPNKAPQFTSTITLNPEQQAILDAQTRSEQGLATLGEEQIGRIRGAVSAPFSFSGLPGEFAAEDAATASRRGEEALLSRLNPQFARDEEALRTRLINQGIGQGSDAYKSEMQNFAQAQNDARMQAILQGANYGGTLQNQALQRRQQAINEYTTQRNAPLNEYIGLTSGVQVQNPQFQNTGYQGTAPVDIAGMINNQYQGQLGQYNARVAQNNATTGALFGLGGSVLSAGMGPGGWLAALSDIRAKENINRIGTTPGGIGVYEYNYIGDGTPRVGVMAQEVEKIIPEAVTTGSDGLKRVYYEMVI